MINYLKNYSSENLDKDMTASEYSYNELGLIQKANAILSVNELLINILDLKNRGFWSEYRINKDLIECIISKLDTTFNDMGSIMNVSNKFRNYSDKLILKFFDECKKYYESREII